MTTRDDGSIIIVRGFGLNFRREYSTAVTRRKEKYMSSPYRSVIKLLQECPSPVQYNFELECGYNDYASLPPIERFLTYKAKALGKIMSKVRKDKLLKGIEVEKCYYPEAERFCAECDDKYPLIEDCDASGLAVSLYDTLWLRTDLSLPFGNLGGDTLNSVQTSFDCYLSAIANAKENEAYLKEKRGNFSLRYCIQLYRLFGDEFIQKLSKNKALIEFINLYHTMGNFWLVPKGYNQHRGKSATIRDYADLSLFNLLYNCDGNTSYFGENEEERKQKFTRYINFSFAWDYVRETPSGYEVLPLCNSHNDKMCNKEKWDGQNVLPKYDELEDLCSNINSRIIRRGLFMKAMLKIAAKYPDAYKRLINEVFLSEQIYDGYNAVLCSVRETLRSFSPDAERELSSCRLEEKLNPVKTF